MKRITSLLLALILCYTLASCGSVYDGDTTDASASDTAVVGSSPEIIRHFVELRGIGVIDVKEIFGMGAVKDTESIDLIIHLEPWVEGKQYDRLGMVDEYTNIMGINIPSMTVPVKIGRNIAVIIEVAAMNNRQKKMGYNAAIELNNRLMKRMQEETEI